MTKAAQKAKGEARPVRRTATDRPVRVIRAGSLLHNEDVAKIFDEIADIVELQGGNIFRIRAYRNAARTLRGLSDEVGQLVARGERLDELPGIGEDLASQITEILQAGNSRKLMGMRRAVPALALDLCHLPGIGPKKAMRLCAELKPRPRCLTDVLKACQKGHIRCLHGFGKATEDALARALTKEQKPTRFKLPAAHAYAQALLTRLRDTPGVTWAEVAGSYRRCRETVGDIDLVVASSQPALAIERFLTAPEVQQTLDSGPTKSSVSVTNGMQVDLRVVEPASFGAALLYFTGSKAHNIALRRRAQQRGLKINEYGVFRGSRRIAGDSEVSVYESLDLPYIEPELREDAGEIAAGAARHLPSLVQLQDIGGDLHVHTKASDGQNSITEMVDAARRRGLSYIAITDHSKRVAIAHGLTAERLSAQMDKIDEINASLRDFTVLKGVEVDILRDGSLDLPDSVLGRLDLVIVAIHSHFGLPRTAQTDRILRALDHRYVSILAHPTNRLLLEREPCDFAIQKVLEAARDRGCALEINAHPDRLDLADVHCRLAKEIGVRLSLGTDAHRAGDLAFMPYGLGQARRGWLEAKDLLNTRSAAELKRLLRGAKR